MEAWEVEWEEEVEEGVEEETCKMREGSLG